MARRCDICQRGTQVGQNVPRKGLPKRKGGAGEHRGVQTKRTFKINLVSMRVLKNSCPVNMKICSRCLKANKAVRT